MFKELKEINIRPLPFQFYTADDLWTNEHTSKQMLKYHLNESIDVASRNKRFIERSVDWIVSYFNVDSNTEIADFGCGPGLYTNRLAERGAVVTGIDFSKTSLDYAKRTAKEKGLDVNYVLDNYLDFETTSHFDLITMIMCDFCVLSPEQRQIMLSKFHSLLKPDGSVLLDVYSLNSFNDQQESASYELNQLDGFWSPDDYYCFVNTYKYEQEKVSLDKYTIIEKSRKREVYNWLQYYSRESLSKEFEANGFVIKDFFSDVSCRVFDPESNEFAVAAKNYEN
jgi:SAM-dependent methyltransferase